MAGAPPAETSSRTPTTSPQTPSQWAQWLITVQTAINRNPITEQPVDAPDRRLCGVKSALSKP